jgi:hypothetical protein
MERSRHYNSTHSNSCDATQSRRKLTTGRKDRWPEAAPCLDGELQGAGNEGQRSFGTAWHRVRGADGQVSAFTAFPLRGFFDAASTLCLAAPRCWAPVQLRRESFRARSLTAQHIMHS